MCASLCQEKPPIVKLSVAFRGYVQTLQKWVGVLWISASGWGPRSGFEGLCPAGCTWVQRSWLPVPECPRDPKGGSELREGCFIAETAAQNLTGGRGELQGLVPRPPMSESVWASPASPRQAPSVLRGSYEPETDSVFSSAFLCLQKPQNLPAASLCWWIGGTD